MEYSKNDMYVQLDQRKRTGWTRTSAPAGEARGVERVVPAERPATVEKVVKVEKAAAFELELDMGREVEEVDELIPVPPMIELPQEGQYGYCITTAMSYTPIQKWGKVYEAGQALDRGTIFPVLDYPFMGKGGCK